MKYKLPPEERLDLFETKSRSNCYENINDRRNSIQPFRLTYVHT